MKLKVKSIRGRQYDNKTNKHGTLAKKYNTKELPSLVLYAQVYDQFPK